MEVGGVIEGVREHVAMRLAKSRIWFISFVVARQCVIAVGGHQGARWSDDRRHATTRATSPRRPVARANRTLGDVRFSPDYVRFTPESGHLRRTSDVRFVPIADIV